jgi:hypothetical protein
MRLGGSWFLGRQNETKHGPYSSSGRKFKALAEGADIATKKLWQHARSVKLTS